MTAFGFLASALPLFGVTAWASVAVAARADRTLSVGSTLPAPANDASGSEGGAVAARRPRVEILDDLEHAAIPVPARMRALPRDERGLPIPYLAGKLAGLPYSVDDGANHAQLAACHSQRRCWLCGEKLGRYTAFLTEPVSSVTRIAHSPATHTECAKYAAQSRLMVPADTPVALVWVSRGYGVQMSRGALVFVLADPEQVFWYAAGRLANRDEVSVAVREGLPRLYAIAHEGGQEAVSGLDLQVARATRQFPPHAAFPEACGTPVVSAQRP